MMVEASSCSDNDGGVAKTKSRTKDDLEELTGCLNLGFGFTNIEIHVLGCVLYTSRLTVTVVGLILTV